MRNIATVFLSLAIGISMALSSCEKNVVRAFTSDYQDEFVTDIEVNYDPALNQTRVLVLFPNPTGYYSSLSIPNDSYLKVNGIDLLWYEYGGGYYYDFNGKPTCTIEFKDIDGAVYKNTLVPPDTAYLINFPDMVVIADTNYIQVNAITEINESTDLGIGNSGHIDRLYNGKDSIIRFYNAFLSYDSPNLLIFKRTKTPANIALPEGGGSVQYNYVINREFYVKK